MFTRTTICKIFVLTMIIAVLGLSPAYWGSHASGAAMLAPTATTITVNIGRDLSTSMSESCATYPTACSLRRAIVQARSLPAESRPVLIQFNIPATADEGYLTSLQIWRLTILSTSDQYVFRDLTGGQITIDGSTQPGGRTSGPKIILVGPGTGSKNGINISSGEGYLIRGLGFQNFRTALMLNGNNSIIENNWFGLANDGALPFWRDEDDHSQGSGSSGLEMGTSANGNTARNNVFLGSIGNAAVIRGEGNTFANNKVGTNSAGAVPGKLIDPSLLCTIVDWYGGSGLLLDGPEHVIDNNIIAGIRLDVFQSSSQPDAIWAESTCDRCIIRNNRIGVDSTNKDVGVCGQGIDLTNVEDIEVLANIFAETYHSALFLNGALYKDTSLRGNIIRRSTPWLAPEGSAKPDDAILRYTGLPDAFENFKPAKVTSIVGRTVTGTAGDGNPCPNCIIELFLDDNDGINEALQLLATVTANSSGNWTATIPFVLSSTQGIRTSSTTAQYNTIPYMNAGTTAGLSVIYMSSNKVYLPSIIK